MQPIAQGIASLFMGNPGALQQKIQKEQQANPGLPPDLKKLMALNIVTNEADAAKQQAAINALNQMAPAGQEPPTVAQSIQEQAKQKMQAQMLQQMRQQQGLAELAKQQMGQIPENVPQPERQPQGIDELPVEFGMAGGGIVAFQNRGSVPEPTPEEVERELTQPVNQDLLMVDNPVTMARADAERREKEFEERVGRPDYTAMNRLMAELERQKAATVGPERGFAGLMEFLGQIAATPRGLSSMEAGAMGARGVQALERERETRRSGLIEKQIELEQKKIDSNRQYAKDVFGVGTNEFDRMLKANMDMFKEKGENNRLALRHANEKLLADLKNEHDIAAAELKYKRDKELAAMRLSEASVDERVVAKAERIANGKEKYKGESGPAAAGAYIEDIGKSAAARQGVRYTGQDKTFERQVQLQKLYSTDPRLKSFADALALAEMGNQPERTKRLHDAIAAREKELAATLPQVPGKPDTPPPFATTISPEEFNKKWATLRPGQTLVGPDGVTYTKQKTQ